MDGNGLRFDLVCGTLGRSDELDALLASLDAQTHRGFRVLLVDQNDDDRVAAVVARHPGLEVARLRSERGLSRARNAALGELAGDIVGFPDDDCSYPPDLLERVAARFAAEPSLGGLTGRTADGAGRSRGRWPAAGGPVTRENLWSRANSASLFLRRDRLERAGGFDETLGLGSGTAWSSGEEIDLLARVLAGGARVEHDPSLVVRHAVAELDPGRLAAVGRRDGASLGYVLARNRYPVRTFARFVLRSAGGAVVAVLRGDREAARFQAATLRGRLVGYRAGRRAVSS